jgi:hypothetical protein
MNNFINHKLTHLKYIISIYYNISKQNGIQTVEQYGKMITSSIRLQCLSTMQK